MCCRWRVVDCSSADSVVLLKICEWLLHATVNEACTCVFSILTTTPCFHSERVYLAHRGFTVIDPKFREMLQNDIRGVFLARYKAFFDKYSRIQFSNI